NGRRVFDRARDILTFAALAGLGSTAVCASIGVTSLSLGGYASWERFGAIWLTWWLGDAAGALVVAPVLILWGMDRVLRLSQGDRGGAGPRCRDRGVVGRRDHRQDTGRDHHDLERGRPAALRVLVPRGDRMADRARHPPRPRWRAGDDPRAARPRRADGSLRDGPGDAGRAPDRRVHHGVPDPGRGGADRRRLVDRPGHHPQEAGRGGRAGAGRPPVRRGPR